jgi:DNA polymerase-3 subunit delta'
MEGNHPDFITVEDPEHKNVAVKIVREIRDDMFIRPNEAEHKIYLFPQELGLEGQNALLKILEEPPAYGVFILLTDNPDKLLPTVRSRCTELKMQALDGKTIRNQLRLDFPNAPEEDIQAAVYRSGAFLGQARKILEDGDQVPIQTEQFVESFCRKDALLLTQLLVPMEKWKRDALSEILQSWLEILESALTSRTGLESVSAFGRQIAQQRTAGDIRQAVWTLKKAREYVLSNVSPAAVCGWLIWALR